MFKRDRDGLITVSFLLAPEYAMIALLSAIEPLRVANRLVGREIFRWQLLTEDGQPVYASNGMAMLSDHSLHHAGEVNNLIVCSSFHPERYISESVLSWLRRINSQGALLGTLDTGCYFLARAGLLDGYRVTMHWEAVPAFQEAYPKVTVTDELFEIDRNRVTCAGGTAAIDMMLHLIQIELGRDIALGICEQFISSGVRSKSDHQRLQLSSRLGVHNAKLLKIIESMEKNLEQPLSLQTLAQTNHISMRQLERLFRHHLQDTPTGFYMKLRLERARQLLRQSDLNVIDVAIAWWLQFRITFLPLLSYPFRCQP